MLDKLKIGIIGVGFIGEYHIQAFKAIADAEVTAICDVSESRLAAMKNEYHIPSAYSSISDMLTSENLDGVLIATPDQFHRQPVAEVAAAGIPMLLEKPIALTLADAEAIIEAAERANVPVLQGISIQFHPMYAAIRERWQTGEFGPAHTIYSNRLIQIDNAQRFKGRCSVNQYVACHDFHWMMSVVGKDVESIYALKSNGRAYAETGEADSYWNLLKWKNGAIGSALMTWAMPESFENYVEDEILVIGPKGAAEKNRSNQLRFLNGNLEEIIAAEGFTGLEEYVDQGNHFLEVIRGEAEPVVTLLDGLRAQKLIWGAEESIKTGQPVDIRL